jgi:hypothetical protein
MTGPFTARTFRSAAWSVPAPFRSFAVRSEEARHAHDARSPYDRVHVVRAGFLDGAALARLASQGRARMSLQEFSDVDYADVSWRELDAIVPLVGGLAAQVAAAVHATDVLGDDLEACLRCVTTRVDFLGSLGAGFHNDVRDHWTACLFWNLTLAANDIEFVLPHAHLRIALAPGDLLVFDQTLAHGLCRPRDQGQAIASSFAPVDADRQVFLTGELALPDDRWAALGSPWSPIEEHARRGALDLLVAEFDECSGAIRRARSLMHRMQRGGGERSP